MTSFSDSCCHLYVVRHGETEWNVLGKLQGHTDIPLNDKGVAQALQLKEQLSSISFSAAFSSDLSRARHTAELILGERPISLVTSPLLRERYSGDLEGKALREVDHSLRSFFTTEAAQHKESYLNTPWFPTMESSRTVINRVVAFLKDQIATPHAGRNLLVVSHGGVLRALLDDETFVPGRRWMIANCGFLKMRFCCHTGTLSLLETQGASPHPLI